MDVKGHWKHTFQVLVALVVISTTRSVAQDVVLTSWYDFSSGYGNYQYSGSAKSADVSLPDVSGELWGARGARDVWGSNDGTYGSSVAVGNDDVNGAMTMRTDRNFVDFTIVNNSPGSLELTRILFDFASVNGNSPKNLKLFYFNGDLNNPNSTLIKSWTNIHNGLGTISDYEDEDVDLSGLNDRTLATGQTAKFRFQVDSASNPTQAMLLDNVAIMGVSSELRVLTYNIHGGKGPNDEGDLETNLQVFRDTLMKNPDVLCLQEVGSNSAAQTASDWIKVKNIFSEYPHTYQTVNNTTAPIWPWQTRKQTSIAILSKYPLVSTHSQLIQTDPQGDKWDRNAQHVQIKVGEKLVDIFNFHNTYNFFENDYESEKEGLVKFKDYVLERLSVTSISAAKRLLMLGDFNVRQVNVDLILASPSRQSHVLDHIAGTPVYSAGGNYDTVTPDLSDHRAVWVSLDLRAPIPDAMTWAAAPADASQTSITMTATTASDANDVEYYFSNTTITGTSHDSGWQESPVFVDTGLTPATQYTYTVMARDKSANANETLVSVAASAHTDDGDSLPNGWELLYFPNLNESTAAASDDWDKDGTSDYDEWVAGTDPTDQTSHFSAWLETDSMTDVTALKWSAVSGRSYRVLSSTMMNSDWVQEASGITPEGAVGSYDIDTTGGGNRFYRVEVSQ